jgi:hypothetical protein
MSDSIGLRRASPEKLTTTNNRHGLKARLNITGLFWKNDRDSS